MCPEREEVKQGKKSMGWKAKNGDFQTGEEKKLLKKRGGVRVLMGAGGNFGQGGIKQWIDAWGRKDKAF